MISGLVLPKTKKTGPINPSILGVQAQRFKKLIFLLFQCLHKNQDYFISLYMRVREHLLGINNVDKGVVWVDCLFKGNSGEEPRQCGIQLSGPISVYRLEPNNSTIYVCGTNI